MYMQRILLFLSDVIIPLFIVVILMAGLLNRRNAYEDFVKGARDGLKTAVDILPTLAGLLLDVYEQFGTDSRLGRIASVMMSSSETIFYTMSIYFMTVKVKKTRWTLAGALVATVAGIMASMLLVG